MIILNTIELTGTVSWVKTAAIVLLGLFVLSMLLGIGLVGKDSKRDKIGGWCFIIATVAFFAVIILGWIADSDRFIVPNGKYQYEVLINDETSFVEITEKYDIIEQRGEIFVVAPKENE